MTDQTQTTESYDPFVDAAIYSLAGRIAEAICMADERGYKRATIKSLLLEFAEEIQRSAIDP